MKASLFSPEWKKSADATGCKKKYPPQTSGIMLVNNNFREKKKKERERGQDNRSNQQQPLTVWSVLKMCVHWKKIMGRLTHTHTHCNMVSYISLLMVEKVKWTQSVSHQIFT